MIADLLEPDDRRWQQVLQQVPHDIYHTPSYVRFAAESECGRPGALYAEEAGAKLLIPLVLRALPSELDPPTSWTDAASPYGYASPLLITPEGPSEVVSRMLDAIRRTAVEHEIVTAFVRLHPLLPIPIAELERAGSVVHHGETIWLGLAGPPEDIRKGVREGHRYDIKKLRRNGFVVETGQWSRYEDFIGVYLETMQRVSADEYYMFSSDYFEALRKALGDSLHLCTVAAPDGTTAAAGLFAEHDGIVQYLFSGTSEPYLRQAPTKLMIDHVIEWASVRGNRLLHLGGGVGGREDSLFNFKAGFSKERSAFRTWRVILDQERYETLLDRQRTIADRDDVASGFFPPYRAPISRAVS